MSCWSSCARHENQRKVCIASNTCNCACGCFNLNPTTPSSHQCWQSTTLTTSDNGRMRSENQPFRDLGQEDNDCNDCKAQKGNIIEKTAVQNDWEDRSDLHNRGDRQSVCQASEVFLHDGRQSKTKRQVHNNRSPSIECNCAQQPRAVQQHEHTFSDLRRTHDWLHFIHASSQGAKKASRPCDQCSRAADFALHCAFSNLIFFCGLRAYHASTQDTCPPERETTTSTVNAVPVPPSPSNRSWVLRYVVQMLRATLMRSLRSCGLTNDEDRDEDSGFEDDEEDEEGP